MVLGIYKNRGKNGYSDNYRFTGKINLNEGNDFINDNYFILDFANKYQAILEFVF